MLHEPSGANGDHLKSQPSTEPGDNSTVNSSLGIMEVTHLYSSCTMKSM